MPIPEPGLRHLASGFADKAIRDLALLEMGSVQHKPSLCPGRGSRFSAIRALAESLGQGCTSFPSENLDEEAVLYSSSSRGELFFR